MREPVIILEEENLLKNGMKCFKFGIILFILFVLTLVTTILSEVKAETYGNINKAVYLYNYDGDTITFDLPSLHPIIGSAISIRVRGVDTPEKRGKCIKEKALAVKAGNFVHNKLINARKIRLKDIERGKYFRIVAEVMVDDENLSDLLLEAGLAVPYDGGTKTKDWCE